MNHPGLYAKSVLSTLKIHIFSADTRTLLRSRYEKLSQPGNDHGPSGYSSTWLKVSESRDRIVKRRAEKEEEEEEEEKKLKDRVERR